MSVDIIAALALPDRCRVDQRVPKKLLLENGAPTAADRRLVTNAVEEIQWIAALKPNTVGVPEYRDEQREYLEIAVLSLSLRTPSGKTKSTNLVRLAELVHRAIPYPVLLLLRSAQTLTLSLAHKRWAQNEAGRVVLDGGLVSATIPDGMPMSATTHAFMQAMALDRQPRATLFELYQGWMECVHALQAAKMTGTYRPAEDAARAAARRRALQEYQRLESEAACLRAAAGKARQIAQQVELNLALKNVLARLDATRQQL